MPSFLLSGDFDRRGPGGLGRAQTRRQHRASGVSSTRLFGLSGTFGMIFTVIIALEFKRSLLVVAERRHGIVQVRTVVLIALLAIVRKLMIIDLSATDANQLFALSSAILALGGVFWLVRDQDRREEATNEP
jgi:uncharacterized membrane protein (DUF373 family)